MSDSASILSDISNAIDGALDCKEVHAALTAEQADYLLEHWDALADVDAIWACMDDEWDRTCAGYGPDDRMQIGQFYASPVWLLNGIFTQADPESRQHRMAIADRVATLEPSHIVDFGGGFGSLARTIRDRCPEARIEIIEPFPTQLAKALAAKSGVQYDAALPKGADVILAQDVLEHVTDPLDLFGQLLSALDPGGTIITANCFHPVIKCHYPGALHFAFTFRHIAPFLGCRFVGFVPGADHAEIFEKTARQANWPLARSLEKASRLAYPARLAAGRIGKKLLRR